MTIARGLLLLLAIPLLDLVGLGGLLNAQLAGIESHSQFMSLQVESLSALGGVLRLFEESRVSLRTYLLTEDGAVRKRAEASLRQDQGELDRMLARYSDFLIPSGGRTRKNWSAAISRPTLRWTSPRPATG